MFFKAAGDGPEVFELVEEPLDQIALSVESGIDRALDFAIALGGDVSPPAMRFDEIEHGARIVSAIGDDVAGARMPREKALDRRLVRSLPGREGDGDRQSARVDHRIDLGAQSSTRTTEGVIRPPFFAAACWWARMMELSMSSMLSGDLSARVSKTRTQTPALAHLLKRL